MKIRLSIFILGCIISCTFAARHYSPHKKKVEVTYADGDKVVFLTRYTTMEVTGLHVISRNDIQYTIPTNYLANIQRPQIETVSLKFQVMGKEYEEGSFFLGFYYGTADEKGEEYPFADFIFEQGRFFDSLDSWLDHQEQKRKHNQQVDPIVTTPVESGKVVCTQPHFKRSKE